MRVQPITVGSAPVTHRLSSQEAAPSELSLRPQFLRKHCSHPGIQDASNLPGNTLVDLLGGRCDADLKFHQVNDENSPPCTHVFPCVFHKSRVFFPTAGWLSMVQSPVIDGRPVASLVRQLLSLHLCAFSSWSGKT